MQDQDLAEAGNVRGVEEFGVTGMEGDKAVNPDDRAAMAVDQHAQEVHAHNVEATAATGSPPTEAKAEGDATAAAPTTMDRRTPHWSTFFTQPGSDFYAPFPYECAFIVHAEGALDCLLYTSPSPRD